MLGVLLMVRRTLPVLAAVALLAGALSAHAGPVAAAPATGSSSPGCSYPYVCFSLGESDAERFEDVTSGRQAILGPMGNVNKPRVTDSPKRKVWSLTRGDPPTPPLPPLQRVSQPC